MAFALAIRNTLTESRRLMLTSTSVVSIMSVIFCGGSIQPLLNHFFIATNVDDEDQLRGGTGGFGPRSRSGSFSGELISPADDVTVGQPSTSTTLIGSKNAYEKAWLVRKWYDFDVNFMKPLLTHSRPSLMETMPCCLPISRFLTSTQQMAPGTEPLSSDHPSHPKVPNLFTTGTETNPRHNYHPI